LQLPATFSDEMSISKKTRSDVVAASIKQYLTARGFKPSRNQISVPELTTLAVVDREISIKNAVTFTADRLDPSAAETQYTKFKVWISESADHYKPELAQLLYPLFTHIYIRLLSLTGALPIAHRFHKRHLSTFQGNPEFKLFIQQLGELNSLEEVEQNPSISSFVAARYCVTLTDKTYNYLLSYLSNNECNLILDILNQEVDVTVGDWLGAGSRQDARAGLKSPPYTPHMQIEDAEKVEVDRLSELTRQVRNTSPTAPSTALYKIHSKDGVCVSGRVDRLGRFLVAGGEDSVVRLWHVLPTQKQIVLDVSSSSVRLGCDSNKDNEEFTTQTVPPGRGRLLRGHEGTVYDAIFTPDDRLIVSVSEDTTVRLWDKDTGAGLASLHGHMYPVWSVATDCLGTNMATGSMDRTARLWRPEVAHPLRVYAGHEQDVDCVSFHPNSNYLMTGSCDRTVRMWSVTEGDCARVLIGHKGAISTVQVSPCGKIAASAGEDKKIRIWDLAEGKQIKELKGHTDTVTELVWGDSRMLFSAGMDGIIRVWDVGLADNELLETFPVGGGCVLGATLTETNTLIAVSQDNKSTLNGS